MAVMCPKCGSALGSLRHAAACGVTKAITRAKAVTETVTYDVRALDLHTCPTCGQEHRIAKTNRERQRAYRDRSKA